VTRTEVQARCEAVKQKEEHKVMQLKLRRVQMEQCLDGNLLLKCRGG
jgi:hypothetical protein